MDMEQEKEDSKKLCCGHNNSVQIKDRPEWVVGYSEISVGLIPKVTTEWSKNDYWGQIKCRISGLRMKYIVSPGLYAVGEPDRDSDVFVSANYKLSFDILRRNLRGLKAWILVLDTKGINVWCAAGKGTFGTDELIGRINAFSLNRIVNHRRLILPQLSAPGINASVIKKICGFRVYFGPVYAKDIFDYLNAGYKKTKEMGTIRFTILDRLILTPMEIIPAMKYFPLYALIVLIFFGINAEGILFRNTMSSSMPFLLLGIVSIFSGALITPLLLPFIPFHSFAVKGWITGMIIVSFVIKTFGESLQNNALLIIFTYIFFPFLASYIALQFTGSTTFTGISGVKKELKTGIPVYITALVISVILLVVYKIKQFGVI